MRYASSDVIKETEALSLRSQSANTKRLAERLHDINYWKSELQREITDMISETDLLCQQKLRLENALRATEIPLHIATDNLHCRQRRQGIDLVQDDVEINLLKVRSYVGSIADKLYQDFSVFFGSVRVGSTLIKHFAQYYIYNDLITSQNFVFIC